MEGNYLILWVSIKNRTTTHESVHTPHASSLVLFSSLTTISVTLFNRQCLYNTLLQVLMSCTQLNVLLYEDDTEDLRLAWYPTLWVEFPVWKHTERTTGSVSTMITPLSKSWSIFSSFFLPKKDTKKKKTLTGPGFLSGPISQISLLEVNTMRCRSISVLLILAWMQFCEEPWITLTFHLVSSKRISHDEIPSLGKEISFF